MIDKIKFSEVYQALTEKSAKASELEKELEKLYEEIKMLRIEMMGCAYIK